MSMKAAPLGPFTIHSDQAQAWEFGSFSDAAHFIRRNRLEMSEHPLPGREEGVWKGYFGTRYILRDECGLIVPTWRIAREIEALEPVPLPRWYVRRHGNYDPDRDFRNGPVPGDGNGRWGGRFLRHMKTRQELRELKGLEADMRDLVERQPPWPLPTTKLAGFDRCVLR